MCVKHQMHLVEQNRSVADILGSQGATITDTLENCSAWKWRLLPTGGKADKLSCRITGCYWEGLANMLLPGDFAYEQRQGLQISRAAVASQEDHRVDKAVLA